MSKDHWPKQPIELQPSAEARQKEKETLLLVKVKVLKLIRRPDSVARGVALETIVNGSKRRLEGAVQQVYPLELRCQEEDIKDDKLSAPDGPPRQTKREAALNAKAKISTLAEDINQTHAD